MPHVKFTDRDGGVHEGEVDYGTDVMDDIEQISGVDLPHSCGRGGWCSTCVVNVVKGKISSDDGEVTEMGPEEIDTMEQAGLDAATQVLSCSSQVYGDCEFAQLTEDPPDLVETNAPGK